VSTEDDLAATDVHLQVARALQSVFEQTRLSRAGEPITATSAVSGDDRLQLLFGRFQIEAATDKRRQRG
jgi:hypothetical protein